MIYARKMAVVDLKKRLLQTLAASADREAELHRLSAKLPPANTDPWGAKDHVAHLAHWRRHAAKVPTSRRAGAARDLGVTAGIGPGHD